VDVTETVALDVDEETATVEVDAEVVVDAAVPSSPHAAAATPITKTVAHVTIHHRRLPMAP
jgi:hypothetical protein